jgi:hypothetical protein
MRRAILATLVLIALAGTSLAVGAQIPAARDSKIGTRVTITGCLHQGTSSDSFVLMGVTERPADSPPSVQPVPWAIYWLDSTEGLKARVGEMVDVTGKITDRRPEAGKITVSIDASDLRAKDVQVTSASKAPGVTTEKYEPSLRPVGTSGTDSTISVSRPVYKLDVETVVHAANFLLTGPVCR